MREEDVSALLSQQYVHGLAVVQLLEHILHRFLFHIATNKLVIWTETKVGIKWEVLV